MKLAENTFKRAISDSRPQVGLWNSLCSNFAADVVSSVGYDWCLLDMEHSPNDLRTVLGQMQAMQQGPSVPIVRPPWIDFVLVKRLLDAGAMGLLFPMVQSPEEAEAAVRATRYPPNGIRGVSMAQRGNKFGRVTDYFERVEEETAILVQIETREALALTAEIAAVDGVDGVFFGPADIAADMGLLGQAAHPDVWAAIGEAAEIVRDAGKPAGTLVQNAEKAVELFGQGFSFVACGSDLGLLARGADKLLADVKAGLGS
ncbi:MAG: HpcH/HpaI aldolase/citrate lyase family protein [Pseudomonadota bacterium]